MPDKRKIKEMFDGIASDYDRLNHLMSLGTDKGWRRRALRQIIKPDTAQQILDIACGTGDFSIAMAESMAAGSSVTGLDISPGMLDIMRTKVETRGLQNRISIVLGDSEKTDFPDSSFDCVTIAFGIRNFQDRQAALLEILRVLKPGGKLVILELSVPSSKILRWAYNIYFTKVVPVVGGRISGDKAAYKYLPASVLGFPAKDEWMATMRGCGYAKVAHKAFTLGICRMYTGIKK